MKVRSGFVSNSSTSSFCIYGALVSDSIPYIQLGIVLKKYFPNEWKKLATMYRSPETEKIVEALLDIDNPEYFRKKKVRACDHDVDTNKQFCPECGLEMWKTIQDVDEDDIVDHIQDRMYDFEPLNICGDDRGYIGRSYKTASDQETFGEFRRNTELILEEIFGEKVECSHIEETYCS